MSSTAKSKHASGFSLIELLISMGMISALLSVVIPNVRAMIAEGQLTKVDGELVTLKNAITSYWRNQSAYPANVHTALVAATPQMIAQILPDPFNTDAVNQTYGYLTGTDSAFGPYFVVYSQGPRGDTVAPTWDASNQWFTYSGSGRVISNAPAVQAP